MPFVDIPAVSIMCSKSGCTNWYGGEDEWDADSVKKPLLFWTAGEAIQRLLDDLEKFNNTGDYWSTPWMYWEGKAYCAGHWPEGTDRFSPFAHVGAMDFNRRNDAWELTCKCGLKEIRKCNTQEELQAFEKFYSDHEANAEEKYV